MIISRDLWMGYFIICDSWFRQLINRDSVTRGGIYTPQGYIVLLYTLWYNIALIFELNNQNYKK